MEDSIWSSILQDGDRLWTRFKTGMDENLKDVDPPATLINI